ncbi:DNA polymerase I [Entomoplasma freundtii]|uniref:DNA polymerase I n=1 Tax=Entomoplasma freundtii TaxID=74700 RepID=A0A2K8NRH2_9MOLU|nr:DNA polymerase I [Entomoplasma freundtii]ATZ16452.1 DNA polymerase I [Entomoplasma freundtii]TDY55982.1 DNA polymerase I [Entomoplasma freundtii]
MTKKILLIDGNSLIYRAYFANAYRTKTILKTSQGIPTNAVYSFINMLLGLLKKESYCDIKVAFDKGKKTWRHQKMPDYKGNRQQTPPELISQLPLAQEFLDSANIDWFAMDKYEADDLIGTIDRYLEKHCPDYEIDILTSDKDLFQLITPKTKLLVPNSGTSDLTTFGLEELKAKWNCRPCEVPDIKGLMGDPSDNLKGVNGIGEKTAIALIGEYGSLENIYDHLDALRPSVREKLIKDKESAFFTREMATIDTDFAVPDLKFKTLNLNMAELGKFLTKYEMVSIFKRLGLTTEKVNPSANFDVQIVDHWESKFEDEENNLFVQNLEDNYHHGKIIGVAWSNKKGNFYWDWSQINAPKQLSFFEDQVLAPQIDEAFARFLLNTRCLKNTYDIKKTLTLLKNAGYKFAEKSFIYDMMVASYDLDPLVKANFPDHLSMVEENLAFLTDEEFFRGSTRQVRNLEINEKAKFIGEKAYLIGQTKTKILEKLKSANQLVIYEKIDYPFIFVLYSMEQTGIEIDVTELREQTQNIKNNLDQLERQMDQILGPELKSRHINYGSPKQLQDLLFEILKLPNLAKGSTGHEVLVQLVDEHPIIKPLLEHRKFSKIYNTYLLGFDKYIFPDKKIHTIFNQTLTSTGRISSGEPNIQNISVRDEDQKQVRKILVSAPGSEFYSFDYSQIELRVIAQVAPEPNLLKIFKDHGDVHEETARKIFNLKPNEPVTREMRRQAKVVNFGIIYGLSPYGLSKDLNISVSEAKKIIDSYYANFPAIAQYREKVINLAKTTGYAENVVHRQRRIPELASANYHLKQFGERVAVNTPLQGTSADILKVAMNNIYTDLQKNDRQTMMVAQIHDEIIFSIPNEEVKLVVPMIKTKMEHAFIDLLDLVNQGHLISIALEVSESHGKNWLELK